MSSATSPAAAIRLMQWRSRDDPALGALAAQWRDVMRRMLDRALAGSDGALNPCWSDLPPEGADRVLTSPAICEGLRTDDPALWKQALLAEYILHAAPEETAEMWASHGDVWLAATPPPGVHSLLPLAPGRLYGPKLDCGVPIDCSLPPALIHPTAGLHAPAMLGAAVQEDVIHRLNAATELISQVSPAAFDLVTAMTSNLVLRVDAFSNGALRSASSPAALGRTVLVDPVGAPPEAFAESLVHEAAHTLLSCAELVQPLVHDPWTAARIEVRSPWTGATLPLQAFLHACAVWSALLAFWARAADLGVATVYARQQLLALRKGFQGLERGDVLGPVDGGLSESAWEMLGVITGEVRDI